MEGRSEEEGRKGRIITVGSIDKIKVERDRCS